MYTSFFGLNEKPFSITPDPRYLFMSERHGEALAAAWRWGPAFEAFAESAALANELDDAVAERVAALLEAAPEAQGAVKVLLRGVGGAVENKALPRFTARLIAADGAVVQSTTDTLGVIDADSAAAIAGRPLCRETAKRACSFRRSPARAT